MNFSLSSRLHHIRLQSLTAKLLLPIVGLMLASLLASTVAFGLGTLYTRNRLITQQLQQDQNRVIRVLNARSELVSSAAAILAANPDVLSALSTKNEANLGAIDSRAVLVRNRFGLDLIQVYDSEGVAWTNLVLAELYQVSSLLREVPENALTVVAVNEHLLLLKREAIQNGKGTIITGIDLGSELKRIASDQRLLSDPYLRFDEATTGNLNSKPPFSEGTIVSQETLLRLGDAVLILIVQRNTAEIIQVTQSGLVVMIASLLATTVLLIFASSRLTLWIVTPIRDLASISQSVAIEHQFDNLAPLNSFTNFLRIGEDDELGQLTQAFNSMLVELRDLTQDLETKVEARTVQLQAASAVARTTNSSLELDTVLQATVEMLCECFNFYFAGVFLLVPEKSSAVLRAATRRVGDLFDGNNYLALPLKQVSHITTAIHTVKPVIIQDVQDSSAYLPHRYLPDTRSEAVLPLVHAGTVLGVLDIQAVQVDAFSPDLLDTFATLSNQIAVGIQNAKTFQQQREIARRLAEIDHLKSQFLATVSHELRTPLNAILGFSRILLQGVDGPLNTIQEQDLGAIHTSGERLLKLITDMLDISEIEAGKMELSLKSVDLRSELIGMNGQVEEWIGKKYIRLQFELPEQIPPLMADPIRLRQVLANLLSNAVKFTPSGTITVQATYNVQWVIISVKDTGIGIAPADMDKLFKPFSQVDSSITRRFEGTGLGLSISRYLIELHGGKIWAESEPGAGATFSFVLPLKNQFKG
jgi:signal transduction histidine kinase